MSVFVLIRMASYVFIINDKRRTAKAANMPTKWM